MINKGFILKTAAVVSCVVVLGVTGCQGGVDEAAAVKNKSIEITVHEVKEGDNSNDVSGDGKEDIKAVVRSNGHEGTDASPPHTNKQDMGDGERPTGYDTQDRDNDTERDEAQGRRNEEVKSEAEPSEDGATGNTEESGQTVDNSTPVGAGEGYEDGQDNSAVSESVSVAESASDMGGGEYTDYTDEWYEPDTAGVEAEEGFTDEYSDSGADEAGYAAGAGEWVYYATALITHYCPCGLCCPVAGGTTASGVYPTEGRTVAAGYSIPFGAEVMINGNVYVVEDRGVDDSTFDIFVGDHDLALAMGAYYTDVYIRW